MAATAGATGPTGHEPTYCSFVPRYLLARIAERADEPAADRARVALLLDEGLRQRRPGPVSNARAWGLPGAAQASPAPRRVVSDAGGETELPGVAARSEGDSATDDAATDEAYDGLGATWRLLHLGFERDSLDGAGMPLLASVHYGRDYANAFWDGTQMVFGDGDGEFFGRFTVSLDVIGHELAHGLMDATARLRYSYQPGALNESLADMFGAMVAQHAAGQSAREASWLIGADLFTDRVQGVALRSMLHPGTAYDDPVLGRDPQPESMSGFVHTEDDNGGVHINSGIPNRAFALAATAIGGRTWQGAGAVWTAVLLGPDIAPDCDFATFARLCVTEAGRRWGVGSDSAGAIADAWATVGVASGPGRSAAGSGADLPRQAPDATPVPAPLEPAKPRVVVVGRSGGVTGMNQERRMNLANLPEQEATQWSDLLSSGVLQQLEPVKPQPDRLVYRVRCVAASVDVTAGEMQLPDDVRVLLEGALRRDG